MFFGYINFTCDECGHTFRAPHFEYCATIFAVPQRCPNCGSIHTMPGTTINNDFKDIYKKIWSGMEGHTEHKTTNT